MVSKFINNIIDPDGLVTTLLIFSIYLYIITNFLFSAF